jgi:acetolactate synthase-1/2/3 large subunit
MAMNGLITAYEEGIAIVTVVLNNRALGWVKHGQRDRVIASEFSDIDHAAIARAMNCRGIRVEEPGQLEEALAEALGSGKPTVLDVVTSLRISFEDVMSPLVVPPESP